MAKKPRIPTHLLIPLVPWHFFQPASPQMDCCKLMSAMQKPTAVSAQLQSWPSSSREEGNQKVISVMHAEGFHTHNRGLRSSEGFMSAWRWIWHEPLLWLLKTLSSAMCLAKYLLYMNWSDAFFTSGEIKKNKKHLSECDVLYWGVILGSPLCFLFLLGFLGVVFPLVYIISSLIAPRG